MVQKVAQFGTAQHRLDLRRQHQRLAERPLRQHARMHHQQVLAADLEVQRHRLLPQPVEQGVAVRRSEHVLDGVFAVRLPHAMRGSQQVQVVVAEQAADRVPMELRASQHSGGGRAAVDQVAEEKHRIAAGRKVDGVEQAAQGAVAALHIADQVKCHVSILTPSPWMFCCWFC